MATKFPKEDDPHVAEIYRAIALRFHLRYIDARHLAEYHGGDLPDHGRLLSAGEADDRYAAAADGCVIEAAGSAAAALALVHFAGVLAADRLMGEVTQEPVNPERDAYHQSRALANVALWLNDRAIEDLVKRRSCERCRRMTMEMPHERRHS